MDNRVTILVIVNIVAITLILSKKEYRNYLLEKPIQTILTILVYITFLYWYTRKSHPPPLPNSATCNYCCFSPGHGLTFQPWMCYDLKNTNSSWGYCKEWAYTRGAGSVACCDSKKIDGTRNDPPALDDECLAADSIR
jgi:hypothetical protein